MARRVERADQDLAHLQLEAVVEGLVRVLGVRPAADVDGGAGRTVRRPWPKTWSAWSWVSRMCSIETPAYLAISR